MTTKFCAFLDNAIQSIVLAAPWFKSCRRLCAYISCGALREVDTSKVLAEILQSPLKGVLIYECPFQNFTSLA